MIKILHTSDFRLGADFIQLNKKNEAKKKEELLEVFSNACSICVKQKINLFIIAGNLFNSPYPSSSYINHIISKLKFLYAQSPETKVLLVAGHKEIEHQDKPSILNLFSELPNVYFFDHRQKFSFREFKDGDDKIIVSYLNKAYFDSFTSWQDLKMDNKANFHLCILNEKISNLNKEIALPDGRKSQIISLISKMPCNYLALGGELDNYEFIEEGMICIYPGSASWIKTENLKEGKYNKYFILITIDEGKHKISKINSGSCQLQIVDVNCRLEDVNLSEKIKRIIGSDFNLNSILVIRLIGNLLFDVYENFRKDKILAELEEKFYFVHVVNNLIITDDEDSNKAYRELKVLTPEREFRRYIENEINAVEGDEEKKELLRKVLEVGLKELKEDE